jgi:hypothetical protein
MNQGYHLVSLKHFLEIIDKGVELRERLRPAAGNRRTNVNKIIEKLRLDLPVL